MKKVFSVCVLLGFIFSGCNGGEVRTKAYFANNPDEINSLDCNKEKLSKKEQKECDNAMEVYSVLSKLKADESALEAGIAIARNNNISRGLDKDTGLDKNENIIKDKQILEKTKARLEAIKAGKED